MDRKQLDHWCERGILGLVLAILVYSPLAFGSVRLQEFVVVLGLTAALLLVWLVRFWVNPEHRLLWPPVSWAVLAFMGYAVVRYLTADIEYVARQEVLRVLVYGFLFFAVVNNLHRQETTQIVGLTVVFIGMALALYGLYQFLSNSEHVWHVAKPLIYRKRGSGPFINPNHLAGYLEMAMPLALAYTLTGRLNVVVKVLVGYAALVMFAGLVVTVSRGGWVATTVSLLVFFGWLVRQRDYRIQALCIGGALAVVCAAFFYKAQFSHKRSETLALAGTTEDVRFQLWKPAWAIWQDHFWVGVGPGHFSHRYYQYRPGLFDLQFQPDRVHNDYLNALVDWGVVGGGILLSVWALFYTGVFRSWKFVQRSHNDLAAKRSNRASVVMGGALGLLAILVHSFVDFNLHIPSNAILAVTLLALVAGHFRFATERHWHTVRWPLRIPVNVLLICGLSFLGLNAWRAAAERKGLAAAKAARTATERKAALEQAYRAEPQNAQTAYQIGELLREQSWLGQPGFEELAQGAIQWFQRAALLNPFDPLTQIRLGMCLDWVGKHDEGQKAFQRALDLDPNGYFTLAHVGWHYFQVEDYPTAEKWLERSLKLFGNNPVAQNYLRIVRERMAAPARP